MAVGCLDFTEDDLWDTNLISQISLGSLLFYENKQKCLNKLLKCLLGILLTMITTSNEWIIKVKIKLTKVVKKRRG